MTDGLLGDFAQIERDLWEAKPLHAQNQKLRAARDLLLPRLMSGEMGVNTQPERRSPLEATQHSELKASLCR